MTNEEIIKDFRDSDYISFVKYLDDWFWENDDEEIN